MNRPSNPSKISVFQRAAIAIVLFGSLVIGGGLAIAAEPDLFDAWRKLQDPIRSKAYNVYERYSCNQLPEDEWPVKGTVQKNFTIPPTHFDFSLTSVELVWDIPTFSDLMGQVMGLNTATQAPETILTVTPQDPKPNEPVRLIADTRYFKSQLSALQTIWCIDGKSAMGLAAGGDMEQQRTGEPTRIEAKEFIIIDTGALGVRTSKQTKSVTKTYDAPCCDLLTRAFDVARDDTDDDGLSDAWERRYFANLNQRATDDPDKDGSPDRRFTNNCLTYELTTRCERPDRPPLEAIFRFAPNIQSTSRSGSVITGDSYDTAFTNVEEFVWGTNPTDPDTDDDGHPDGADIIGVGQSQISYVTPNVRFNQQKEFKVQEVTVGDLGSVDEWLTSLTQFVADERMMTVRRGVPLDVYLENLSPTAMGNAAGEVLRIQAYPSSGINADPVALFYQWAALFPITDDGNKRLQRVLIDSEPVRGKHILVTNIQELRDRVLEETGQDLIQAGVPFDIEVEAFANNAKEIARNRITVTLYHGVSFTVTDQQCQPLAEQKAVPLELCFGENASPEYHLVGFDKTAAELIAGTGDDRNPTLVTVQAIPDLDFPAANPFRESDFTYVWRVDGTRATQATHPLTLFVSKRPRDTIEVLVDIYRKSDRLLIAKSKIVLEVVSPEILIVPDDSPDNPIDPDQPIREGDEVTYRVDVDHPGSTPMTFTWMLNGKDVGTGDTYTYKASEAGTDTLSVRSDQAGTLMQKYQSLTIAVEPRSRPVESVGQFVANLSSQLSSLSRSILLFSAIVMAFLGLILFSARRNHAKEQS